MCGFPGYAAVSPSPLTCLPRSALPMELIAGATSYTKHSLTPSPERPDLSAPVAQEDEDPPAAAFTILLADLYASPMRL